LAIVLRSIIEALMIFYGLLVVSLCVPLIGGLYSARPGSSSVALAIVVSVGGTLLIHALTGGEGFAWLSPQILGILISLAIITAGVLIRRSRLAVLRQERK
jgi:SSS family solute:Na+ symporter